MTLRPDDVHKISETDQPTTSKSQEPPKRLEMAPRSQWPLPHIKVWPWTHRGKENEVTKEKLALQSGGWNKEDGLHIGTTWEAVPGSGCLESSGRWPFHQWGPKTVMMMMMMMMLPSGWCCFRSGMWRSTACRNQWQLYQSQLSREFLWQCSMQVVHCSAQPSSDPPDLHLPGHTWSEPVWQQLCRGFQWAQRTFSHLWPLLYRKHFRAL